MRESDLDDLFAKARRGASTPSADLLARILADAEALQPRPAAAAALRPPARRARRGWALALFGGGGVLAGLVTATVAGVWVGLRQPAPVAATFWSASAAEQLDSVELVPGYELFASLDLPAEG